jgi:hypothetical protein
MIFFLAQGAIKGDLIKTWVPVVISPLVEVWTRMLKGALVPEEMGKYFLLLAIILILIRQSKSATKAMHKVGVLVILLLLPSCLYALFMYDLSYENWVFNVLGIIELGILSFLAARERILQQQYIILLQFMAALLVPILVFLTFKTPSFSEITFSLGAIADTTAGFGSNQVSTMLGLGLVVHLMLILLKKPFYSNTVAWGIIGYTFFRGLLTFSRGGMLVAGIALILFLLFFLKPGTRAFSRTIIMALVMVVAGIIIFKFSNALTGNLLSLRYQGETAGTLTGDRKKDLNSITSGRFSIFQADMELFETNLIAGVGPGMSSHLRSGRNKGNYAAHIELSRLLAEHGVGGLLTALLLAGFGIYWTLKQNNRMKRGFAAFFFFLSLATTFHAAMRTNTTVICFAMASIIPLVPPKKKVISVHKKKGLTVSNSAVPHQITGNGLIPG